ncbi:hypothetical protein [Orientia tsutsugamushi]|uniref:hypothetical protein n=1 Tax=Orientia tsutsugamushi TaxID=784 RepID=UPI000D5A508A|nr:conjugal transfer protein TraA [Orientia tsutsugamushi]
MDGDLKESMNSLISDWQKSRFETDEKLVITVRNRDVDELNKEIREVLKASGRVGKEEYQRITSSREDMKCEDFAIGDRIIFKSTE